MRSQFGVCMYTAQGEFLCGNDNTHAEDQMEHFTATTNPCQGALDAVKNIGSNAKNSNQVIATNALNKICASKITNGMVNDKASTFKSNNDNMLNIINNCGQFKGKETEFDECVAKSSTTINEICTKLPCVSQTGRRSRA